MMYYLIVKSIVEIYFMTYMTISEKQIFQFIHLYCFVFLLLFFFVVIFTIKLIT